MIQGSPSRIIGNSREISARGMEFIVLSRFTLAHILYAYIIPKFFYTLMCTRITQVLGYLHHDTLDDKIASRPRGSS